MTATCVIREPDGSLRKLDAGDLRNIDRLRAGGAFVWLKLTDPDRDDLALLEREFKLHPVAMEDLRKRRQRPKLDTYPDQHMIVAYEVRDAAEGDGRDFDLGELHLFAGEGWLVTAHWGASPAFDGVRERLEQQSQGVGTTLGGLLYAILDAATDSYFPLLDRFNERVEALEERILEGEAGQASLRDVLRIKRELLDIRRVLAPMRDMANALLRRDVPLIDDDAVPYFQDLYDHLVRVLDSLDLYRDLVASVLDARLSVTSNSLNAIMKRLTALTVVLMVPTLIAGIYGMNFKFMPELDWPFGYPLALGLMGVAMAGAWAYFRANDWF